MVEKYASCLTWLQYAGRDDVLDRIERKKHEIRNN